MVQFLLLRLLIILLIRHNKSTNHLPESLTEPKVEAGQQRLYLIVYILLHPEPESYKYLHKALKKYSPVGMSHHYRYCNQLPMLS
ncbi:hypothetical protein D3C85_1449740 [compost metagenome]